MAAYPNPVTAYLSRLAVDNRHPAYFTLDDCGTITGQGGCLGRYQLEHAADDMPIGQLLPFTEGVLPLQETSLTIECLELPGKAVVDAHFFKARQMSWLLLLDAEEAYQRQRQLQQKANELILLRDLQARLLDQYLGRDMVAQLLQIDFPQKGQRRVLSILFADIREFTTYCEQHAPEDVFEMLNAYLAAMIQPVLDGGGVVDKIIGDAVMAVFGLLPSTLPAPQLAVAAAQEMLKQTARLAEFRRQAGQQPLYVGAGLATGSVMLGILGSKQRRTFSVSGHSVNLAARLESQAKAGELLMDSDSYALLAPSREVYSRRSLTVKGMQAPLAAHGWATP